MDLMGPQVGTYAKELNLAKLLFILLFSQESRNDPFPIALLVLSITIFLDFCQFEEYNIVLYIVLICHKQILSIAVVYLGILVNKTLKCQEYSSFSEPQGKYNLFNYSVIPSQRFPCLAFSHLYIIFLMFSP